MKKYTPNFLFFELDTLLFSYKNRNIPYYRLPRDTFTTKEQKQRTIPDKILNELLELLANLVSCKKELFIVTNIESSKVKQILNKFKLSSFFDEKHILSANMSKQMVDYYNLPRSYNTIEPTTNWNDIRILMINSAIDKFERVKNNTLNRDGKPQNYKILKQNAKYFLYAPRFDHSTPITKFTVQEVTTPRNPLHLNNILKAMLQLCSSIILAIDFFNNINKKHNFISDTTVNSYIYLSDDSSIEKEIKKFIKQLDKKNKTIEIPTVINGKTLSKKYLLSSINWDNMTHKFKNISSAYNKYPDIEYPSTGKLRIKEVVVIDVGLKFISEDDDSIQSRIGTGCAYHKESLKRNWKKITQRAGKKNKSKTRKNKK